MQTTGYIIDKKTGDKILLLIRNFKYGRWLKVRKTGKAGCHLEDEEIYLNEHNENAFDKLKNGESIGV